MDESMLAIARKTIWAFIGACKDAGMSPQDVRTMLAEVAEPEEVRLHSHEPIMEMALCERHSLVMRVGQLYRFVPVGDCPTCQQMLKDAVDAYGPSGGDPRKQAWRGEFNLNDVSISTFRPRSTGMLVGMDKGVRALHIPTGIFVDYDEDRSQHRNKAKALELLEERVEAYLKGKPSQ